MFVKVEILYESYFNFYSLENRTPNMGQNISICKKKLYSIQMYQSDLFIDHDSYCVQIDWTF